MKSFIISVVLSLVLLLAILSINSALMDISEGYANVRSVTIVNLVLFVVYFSVFMTAIALALGNYLTAILNKKDKIYDALIAQNKSLDEQNNTVFSLNKKVLDVAKDVLSSSKINSDLLSKISIILSSQREPEPTKSPDLSIKSKQEELLSKLSELSIILSIKSKQEE